jgi:hypothetical protein
VTRPTNAPACFAAASMFAHDSAVCKLCPAFDACSVASLETLQAIRHIINVEDLLKRHQKARIVAQETIKKADNKIAAALPPGNIPQPAPVKPVERKTQVMNISFELSKDDADVIAKLSNGKTAAVALQMCRAGVIHDLRESLPKGDNPFLTKGSAYFRVTVDALLSGGFTRASLREKLAKELTIKNNTAGPLVAMICGLLKDFGFAQEIAGHFSINPKARA